MSEIERGDGSFTAEQFLRILRLFNVGVSEFVREDRDRTLEIQNALARLGAKQLHESATVLPSAELEEVHDVIREALLIGEPRLVTAIAPVLVAQSSRLNLSRVYADLELSGYERRLAWVVENTLIAIKDLVRATTGQSEWSKLWRRVEVPLDLFLDHARVDWDLPAQPLDVLDATIRTRRTLEEVRRKGSKASTKWGIVTSLQPKDFVEALKGSHVGLDLT